MKFEDQIGSVFLKNIEKPLDIYTKKINHWYKTDVNYSWQMVISLQSLKWPEEKAKLPHLASKSNSWQSGFTATDHGFSSPFPKSKGLVGFDHLWPSCPSQVWASVGKVQDETANGHGASPWHQTKNQRVCRTDNLDSGLWQKKTMIVVMPDASADATVIFRLIVSIILITIMSIVMMMMMMMVVVYQCLLMVFDGFWWWWWWCCCCCWWWWWQTCQWIQTVHPHWVIRRDYKWHRPVPSAHLSKAAWFD